ncbi:hypothetical protein BDZ94DRAFT_1274471 [Collybia nuda]|uniref:Uncharacterized protein n=1 Tax=Collybia nuda TaxID=64659 RepID=A0A9P6CDE1_9AGAR|nr:hypothetical protein BDZ94DRAFT_1274471 [Collybia nuda]
MNLTAIITVPHYTWTLCGVLYCFGILKHTWYRELKGSLWSLSSESFFFIFRLQSPHTCSTLREVFTAYFHFNAAMHMPGISSDLHAWRLVHRNLENRVASLPAVCSELPGATVICNY